MTEPPAEIARRLGHNAEAVCRRYLSNGRREGHYWLVGNVHNEPGRSLYVRLSDQGGARASAGKWTDAASGEHGDLLDIIAAACGHSCFADTLAEARQFLSLPGAPTPSRERRIRTRRSRGSLDAAHRLWAASRLIENSLAAAYLGSRGIVDITGCSALRYCPRCLYRPGADDSPGIGTAWPALIASVTDAKDSLTGVHRTWLDPGGTAKAPVATPRRTMGHLLGHGVRFGPTGETMAAGEGIETMLSLRQAIPAMPMIAALSAAHLAALEFPQGLKRLYVACDNDAAGEGAYRRLAERAMAQGIAAVALRAEHDDFNTDLMALGSEALSVRLRSLLEPCDAMRFLEMA
ncbi:MAG: toprim domain-containing protein [Blastomonas sp.]|nr:toprim domain-containing protein [Blastomonas sp.]